MPFNPSICATSVHHSGANRHPGCFLGFGPGSLSRAGLRRDGEDWLSSVMLASNNDDLAPRCVGITIAQWGCEAVDT